MLLRKHYSARQEGNCDGWNGSQVTATADALSAFLAIVADPSAVEQQLAELRAAQAAASEETERLNKARAEHDKARAAADRFELIFELTHGDQLLVPTPFE